LFNSYLLGPYLLDLAWCLCCRWPLWGSHYLRTWLTHQLLSICGRGLWAAHPALLAFYYRLLGACIGRGVVIDAAARVCYHLAVPFSCCLSSSLPALPLVCVDFHGTVPNQCCFWLPRNSFNPSSLCSRRKVSSTLEGSKSVCRCSSQRPSFPHQPQLYFATV